MKYCVHLKYLAAFVALFVMSFGAGLVTAQGGAENIFLPLSEAKEDSMVF